MSPESEDGQFIAYRLAQLEKRLDGMQADIGHRFDSVQGTLGSLAFVRKDVYESEHKALQDKVDSARAIAMWALGTTLTAVALVGTLIGVIKLLAGG